MGTKLLPSEFDCYHAAEADEPMFVLLARDKYAPVLVEQWARMRSTEIDKGERPENERAQVKQAYDCAEAMEAWRKKHRR